MSAEKDHIEIVSFHPRHLEVAVLTPEEAANLKRLPDALKRYEGLAKHSVEALTLMVEGRIIASCGVVRVHEGCLELWLVATAFLKEHKVLFCKTMRYFIETLVRAMNPHRIQAFSLADELHEDFMIHLGFGCEGTLRQYDDLKRDYKMWSMLFPTVVAPQEGAT